MFYTKTVLILCLAGLLVKSLIDLAQGIDPATHGIPTALAALVICLPIAIIADLWGYWRYHQVLSGRLGPE